MAGRIYPCIWRTGEGAPTKDEQTRQGGVLHAKTSDCWGPNTGEILHNLDGRLPMSVPPDESPFYYMNPERDESGTPLQHDPAKMDELAKAWKTARGRHGYKGAIQCPGYGSHGNHKPRKSFQQSWAMEHLRFAGVYQNVGAVAVPMYRHKVTCDQWIETAVAWSERMAWFADVSLYIMTGVREIGAKPTPWVPDHEFTRMCQSATNRGVNLIIFDRFDSEADLERAKAMVAGASG